MVSHCGIYSCGVCGDCVPSYPCVCGSRALLVVESRHSVLELVKTTETIESENQRVKSEMSMLDEIAEEAAALAEIQTQPGDLLTAVDSMEAETAKKAGHTVKRMAVATREDGGPEGRPIQVDDCENTVFEGKASGGASDDPIGQTARTEQHQNMNLLQQMTILCQTVQNLAAERTGRQEDFETESLKRQDDSLRMEQTMATKMEDGFKGEQMARQQTGSR